MIRKYFLSKLFVPLIKGIVSPQFKAIFGKLNCWRNIDRRRPYKNDENFVLYKNVLRKYFCQNYLFHSSHEVFLQKFTAIFGKLNCWWNIDRPGSYINGENFVWSQKVLRKYFLSKFFAPVFRGSVSPQFKAIFTKLNFWRNIDRRGPYKNDENLYNLKMCWENNFCQNYLFHSSKEVFLHN